MPQEVFFTITTARGQAFCDRAGERDCLKKNIEKGQHTVVVAPRRYGKTSLVRKVLTDMNVHYAEADLFCVVYTQGVCERLEQGISKVVRSMAPFTKRAIRWISDCFKKANIVVKAGGFELKLDFSKPMFDPAAEIADMLNGLEKFAVKQNKRVVVFLDEFQDLLRVDEANAIQAAIRSVAQVAQNLCFVFSGSSRYMLKKIFDDRNQPLYMCCQTILLNRIPHSDFKSHLEIAAKKRWRNSLPEDVIDKILTVTACHSYYVNLLCDQLWEGNQLPTTQSVQEAWKNCLDNQVNKCIADLEPLNSNRLKILTAVALLGGIKEPNSKFFQEKVDLPLGSMQKTLQFLLDRDYLYWTKDQTLTLVDPLLQYFIRTKIAGSRQATEDN